MRAISPSVPGLNEHIVAEDQLEYAPLPVAIQPYTDGSYGRMTRWRLTEEERQQVLNGADLFITQLHFDIKDKMTPIAVSVGQPPQ